MTPTTYRRRQKLRALLYGLITRDMQPYKYQRHMLRRIRAAERLINTR